MTFDERFVFESSEMDNIIYNEHKVRYEFACQFVEGMKVLDIASGSGYGTSMLADAGAQEVTGVDIDNNAIDGAKKKYSRDNLKYIHGSGTELPFSDKSIDVVVSFETIEHLSEYKLFLSEIKRVLRETGVLIISTPNKAIFREKNPYHLKEFEEEEFKILLEKYFPKCEVLKQVNSVASTIISEENGPARFSQNNSTKPQYFVAICSFNDIKSPKTTFVNSNPKALERMRNNPVMKVSDLIYGFLSRLFRR